MRENYVKVSFVVFSADRQPEVRKGHTLLRFSILVCYSHSRFSNNNVRSEKKYTMRRSSNTLLRLVYFFLEQTLNSFLLKNVKI